MPIENESHELRAMSKGRRLCRQVKSPEMGLFLYKILHRITASRYP